MENSHTRPFELPEFEPIEKKFPRWMTVRVIVQQLLPASVSFGQIPVMRPPRSKREDVEQAIQKETAKKNGIVQVNSPWMQRIVNLTPEEDIPRMLELLSEVNRILVQKLREMNPVLEETMYSPLTPKFLLHLSALYAMYDLELRKEGRPTARQIIEHVMGIRSCGVPTLSINVVRISGEGASPLP